MPPEIADYGLRSDVIWVSLLVLSIFGAIFSLILVGWWIQRQKDSVCPYTGSPLQRAEYFTFYSKEQVLRFLYDHHSYDNPMFKLNKAAYCRDTGRIFPNAVTWYDRIAVDWSFIQKRCRGNFVSYGSLSDEQKLRLKKAHGSLNGFQTTFTSRRPSPRDVEPDFALAKPGPLYVDIDKYLLMGWKIVPGTDFEVLIVQKPFNLVVSDEINKNS